MRGNRLALAICAVFGLIGVAMLISGPAEVRLLGAIGVLLFGSGVAIFVVPLLTREGPGTVRIVAIGPERGFLFPVARAKQASVTMGMTGIAASGVPMIMLGDVVLGALMMMCCSAIALFGVRTLSGTRGLALTPTRVVVLGTAGGEVPWDAVLGASIFDEGATSYLGITASDSALVRRRGRSKPVVADLAVPADQLAGSPELAVRTLAKYRDHPDRRPEIGTETALGYLFVNREPRR